MSATTSAGDWFAARQRGERLTEHELPEAACDLCGEGCPAHCQTNAASEASGLTICTICLEDMIYAHQ